MPARIAASPLSRAWLIGSCQFQQRAGLAVTFCRGYTTMKPSVSATSLKPEASPIRYPDLVLAGAEQIAVQADVPMSGRACSGSAARCQAEAQHQQHPLDRIDCGVHDQILLRGSWMKAYRGAFPAGGAPSIRIPWPLPTGPRSTRWRRMTPLALAAGMASGHQYGHAWGRSG
ncbi:hypothetical protein G6F57_013451 [Rhizopus arrhizus]|nr:hypothetical protein G6F57_013451 [Rhizopus arrhizus]